MMTSKVDTSLIRELHSSGLTNRQLAKQLGVHHNTVSYHLKKMGLHYNGYVRQPLKVVGGNGICSKCHSLYPLSEFLFNRKGQPYEYRFTYCLKCRRQQLNDNLNSSPEKFLTDRYNRLVLRAKRHGINLTLTKSDLLEQYRMQKGNCFYTDTPLVCAAGSGKNKNSLSIDKVEPSRGYIKGNVVLCTNQVNTIKQDITLLEMQKWMPDWYARVDMWRNELGLKVFQVAAGDF